MVSADDTCCPSQGGPNYCDFSTSQLYCKDGTVSKACTCHVAPTPTSLPTAIPTTPPVNDGPSCPVNASYSTNQNACTCNTGFVASNNSCMTYMAYCRDQYGNNAEYDSEKNTCACDSGYSFNSSGTSCVTMDGLCNEKFGSKSYYNNSDSSCYCYDGYSIQNGQCQLMPTPVPPAVATPTTGVQIIPPTPVVIPTLVAVIVPTHAPTITPMKKQGTKFNFNKKVPGLNNFVAVKKNPSSFFEVIFATILKAFMQAFNI